jgi:hypothetical protein
MRLTFTALGRTWLDLAILDDDPGEPDGTGAAATVELFTGTPPFGFRPTQEPWPPSWE